MEVLLNIGMYHYLVLALILFCIGFWGLIVCRNIIKSLICAEIMLNACAINFIVFAQYLDASHLNGAVFAVFIAVLGLLELGLAAALVVSIYRYKQSTDLERISDIRG